MTSPSRRIACYTIVVMTMAVSSFLRPVTSEVSLSSAESPATATQVVLLGTGTPNADPDRSGPSVAIVVNETPYLIDCGPGIVRRTAAAFQRNVKGLAIEKLNRVFVTHLHSDHTTGFPDLLLTPWVLGRKEPLEVFGPKGMKDMAKNILKAYRKDIHIRLRGGEPSNKTGYNVIVHEISPGVVYKDANLTVKAFAVDHGSWDEAYGFRFETTDRTIVISGDCRPSPSIAQNCSGCDVLIHEVYSEAGFATRPPEWQRYHSRYHTSSKELAELAKAARPGLLILYHQLFWGTTEEDLLNEVRAAYSGKVVSGKDLEVY
jgi:ribonuclease BN (tRNA processing enzyme)